MEKICKKLNPYRTLVLWATEVVLEKAYFLVLVLEGKLMRLGAYRKSVEPLNDLWLCMVLP